MVSVIGLGSAGCNIAEGFRQYPQYTVYQIDVGLDNTKYTKSVKKQKDHEKYDTMSPGVKTFLKDIEGEVLFIAGGSGDISGMSLRILESIKKCRTSVLYVKPDTSFLSTYKKKIEKITFQVLQQYARSGLLERMYIVDNNVIEAMIGKTSVKEFFPKLNEIIVSTIHMINVCRHSKLELSNIENPSEICRISTFGAYSFNKNENSLYNMENVKERNLFFVLPRKVIDEDVDLMNKLRQHVKNKSAGDVKVTFGILPSAHEHSIVYCLESTNFIQGEEPDNKENK